MADKHKTPVIILIVMVAILLVVVIYQFSKPSIQSVNTNQENTLNEIQEEKCPYDYQLKLIQDNFMEESVTHDCSNINGGTHSGDLEIEIEVLNQNDVALSIPCQFIFTKTFFNSDPIHSVEDTQDFNVFVGAKLTKKDTIIASFPSCYTGWKVECNDIEELSECIS